jgi:hypothetical protein
VKYEITLTRPAYEYAEITIDAETVEAAEAEALRLVDSLHWHGGDRLPDDTPKIIETRESED